jgi:hypothetical protein
MHEVLDFIPSTAHMHMYTCTDQKDSRTVSSENTAEQKTSPKMLRKKYCEHTGTVGDSHLGASFMLSRNDGSSCTSFLLTD